MHHIVSAAPGSLSPHNLWSWGFGGRPRIAMSSFLGMGFVIFWGQPFNPDRLLHRVVVMSKMRSRLRLVRLGLVARHVLGARKDMPLSVRSSQLAG